MLTKKSFLISTLIIIITSICTSAEAKYIYAGGSEPNVVYRCSLGGSSWDPISPDFNGAVLCLCEYNGQLYAGTTTGAIERLGSQSFIGAESSVSKKQLLLSRALRGAEIGQVWRYDGGTNWTLVGDNLDEQVCSLIVFRGDLYAGTAFSSGRLYRYDDPDWTLVIDYSNLWYGFRSLYVWNDILYIGDIVADRFGHYDGISFTEDAYLGGSCIWDYEVYDGNLYASAFYGTVYKSSNGTEWEAKRSYQTSHAWELEEFQGYLYVATGPNLARYDGSNFVNVWTEPNGYEIISMTNAGPALIIGTGTEAGSGLGVQGIGKIYSYDGSSFQLISGEMGSGIQALLGERLLELTKTDNVNNDDCVGPGDEITYTITYNYPYEPGLPDLNDVSIIDELPDEADFNDASSGGNPVSGTVIWNLGTLHPGDSGSVWLKVNVKCAQPGINIVNNCEIKCGYRIYNSTYESTPVCCCPTLTKIDNITGCVGPGDDVNYTICYAANGYGDTNVVITDTLPTHVEFISSVPTPDNIIDSNLIWNIGTLEPTESDCVTVTVRAKCAQPGGTITNHCEMQGDCFNPVYADENTAVCSNYPILTKVRDTNDCVGPGSHITYDICYEAQGYGDTNVVIVDELPDELEFVSATGSYQENGGTVTWNIGTLGSYDSNCVTLTAKVLDVEPGSTITNCCEMTGYCITSPLTACEDVCVGYPPSPGSIIYVDSNTPDCSVYYGTSWQWPYKYLQDALYDANHSSVCEQIWVAQGIYKPDVNSAYPDGTGDRTATFQLINDVNIKGGYAGASKPDPNARNPVVYETKLSGDLNGNDSVPSKPEDMLNDPSRAENSYHVVKASGVNSNTVLDGFTITGGNANGEDYLQQVVGGGMYIYNGSPNVENCTLKLNLAIACGGTRPGGGGAIFNTEGGSPKVRNCILSRNLSKNGYGGGMVDESKAKVINCTFTDNVAGYGGHGISGTTKTDITNCIFWGNQVGQISGDANVTYSDIQGGWPGVGNIDEDPMLDSNYHLTLCSSPCIDTGNNEPYGGLPETDIDGEPRIMDGRCIGDSIVDMGADEFYIEDCNIWLYAHCPKPEMGSTAVFYVDKVELSWKAGNCAADTSGHRVYFGTSFDDVNDATTDTAVIYRGDTTDPCYPLKNLAPDYNLILCTTYYWRVDEVNQVKPEPNFWKGSVWSFKFNLFVDDFSYDSQADFNKRWKTHYQLIGGYTVGGGISLVDNSLSLAYDNSCLSDPNGPWSEAMLDYNSPNGVDWTLGGVFEPCAIGVQFYGDVNNTLNFVDVNYDLMYMAIEDTNGRFGIAYNPDPFAPQKPICMEWKVPLTDLTSPNNVDLTEVNRVFVGIGSPRGSLIGVTTQLGGIGEVKFDNLRLYLNVCQEEYGPVGDLTGDFTVNLYDMKIMSQEWLTEGTLADISRDCFVDFRDFAVLVNKWLTEVLPP